MLILVNSGILLRLLEPTDLLHGGKRSAKPGVLRKGL